MPTTPTMAPGTSLDATDRCDRCGAAAYVRVVLPGGGELHFCGHHWNRHSDSLRSQAVDITDETHRLTQSQPHTIESDR